MRVHGEAGWTGRLVPLTVDGLIYASSMVMLDSARRETPVPALARWLLVLGIAATPAANVAHGLGHGPIGAAVAAWPAIALVGSYELLVMVIRSSQAAFDDTSDSRTTADPLQEQAAQVFTEQLAADRVPSIRAIRAQLHVGQPEHSGCETISPQRLAASPSQGLRPSAGWPIPFLTGHRANRPRRGGAVLMLHCMRVTRESLEVRGGSGHD